MAPKLTGARMLTNLAQLTTYSRPGSAIEAPLTHIRPHLTYFLTETLKIISGKRKTNISTISPLLGRALLEGMMTTLLFRLDEFRAITLLHFQSHKDFEHNRPNGVSINWSADLVPNPSEEPKDLWKPTLSPSALSRALLSPYNDTVAWYPAFDRAADFLTASGNSLGFPSVFTLEASVAMNRIRGEARQLYSFWSKGLHCEFFCMSPQILDDLTCAEKLKRTVDILSDLAFMSNFLSTSPHKLPEKKAFKLYKGAKGCIHA